MTEHAAPSEPVRRGPVRSRSRILLASLILGVIVGVEATTRVLDGRSTLGREQAATVTAPNALLDLQIEDGDGKRRSLSEFRGKAVLLNLWATWCVPCRKEMPTLERLQATLGGSDFQVLALSLDRGGPESVKRFFAEIGVANLGVYTVDISALRGGIGLFGLPTTLLIDREGREVERLVGPAEWDSNERIALIRDKLGVVENSVAENRQ